jgi:outer membrane protein assembly factor BamB
MYYKRFDPSSGFSIDVPDYEWGPGSSPIIYKDLVIVQVDQQKGSFLIAVNIKNGETVWKIDRDEAPSWGTPAIYPGKGRVELVTNGSKFIRGYDPETRKEPYTLRNQLSCYDLATGEEKYTERIPQLSSGFTASPVASDGKIYLLSEDGDIFVVRAGPKFELLGKNSVGQLLMATPAISGGMMFVRAERDLFAIGR